MSEYDKQYTSDSGCKIDVSKTQERLVNEALERAEEKLNGMVEDVYMEALYPKDHDEYLVDGAILTCNMATTDVKVLRGTVYNVKSPSNETFLIVTENPHAKCCGYLYHATVKDRKVGDNIPPFRCNCTREPHNDIEWKKLTEDSTCVEEGTCKALINLNGEWDNLPAEVDYMRFWNEDRRGMLEGITMSSILFCRHGGIIYPITSGQISQNYGVFALACTTRGEHKGGLTEEQQQMNAEYIYSFFKCQGWTTEAICGLLGNMQKECGMNPGVWQYWLDDEQGYGLVQWTPANDYLAYAGLLSPEKANEMAINNPQELMDNQLEFFMKTLSNDDNTVECRWYPNLTSSYYSKLPLSDDISGTMTIEEYSKSTCEPKDLALIFHASYERSGDNEAQLQERVDAANKWYEYFKK